MASYSRQYPIAYHVVPLHALKGVWARQALVDKSQGVSARPSTARTDATLGFHGFVHFYLVDAASRFLELPILQAQLSPSARAPFPHAALELETSRLTDAESLICNWNLAVSRPGTGDIKGGNWTRGTDPTRVASVWQSFRQTDPSASKARGFFNGQHLVPTLAGPQIAANLPLLRKAPRGMSELLLQSPVFLYRLSRLLLFSRRDYTTLRLLEPSPLPTAEYEFPGYDGSLVPQETRDRIEAYFCSPQRTKPPDFTFDAVRPVA